MGPRLIDKFHRRLRLFYIIVDHICKSLIPVSIQPNRRKYILGYQNSQFFVFEITKFLKIYFWAILILHETGFDAKELQKWSLTISVVWGSHTAHSEIAHAYCQSKTL